MKAAITNDTAAVVVVGGDGTTREVAGALAGRSIPLVPVPGGTENIVARAYGISADPEAVFRAVLDGPRRPCDLGLINGRIPFLIALGLGVDAEVCAALASRRQGHISKLHYFWPCVQTFLRYGFPVLHVEIDGVEAFHGAGQVFVGIMPHFGGGVRILENAVCDDGLLDVCILPCSSRWGLVHSVAAVLSRRHTARRGCIYRQCNRLRVESACAVKMQTDGDPIGLLPAEVEIRCRALTLVAAV